MAQKAFQIAFDGTPVDQDFYGDIVSLQVEENTSIANTFRLQLATKLADDGSWNYLDDDRLALFTKVAHPPLPSVAPMLHATSRLPATQLGSDTVG